MREIVGSLEHEYRRYKGLAEATFGQLTDEQLSHVPAVESTSIEVIAWHISGNLKSRFTDFLSTDGEKPWRDRESEFDSRQVGPDEVRRKWEDGWSVLFGSLATLSDADLGNRVSIRGESLTVHAALHRSLAHTANHVGQIVLLGKMLRGADWRSLSIPRQRRS